MGAMSIILLAICKRQIFSSKVRVIHFSLLTLEVLETIVQVHPIFVLSVADLFLSALWMIGSGAWLGSLKQRVWCYAVSLPTIVST